MFVHLLFENNFLNKNRIFFEKKILDDKTAVLDDCCSYGKNRSKKSCDASLYNFKLVPKRLQVECKSQIKYCCRRQRETEDCNEGILSAQNGSDCPSFSTKYTVD
jgi:hypothetical protein